MKRDFELVRLLLLELEGEEPADVSAYTKDQVHYREALITEAGFAEGMIHYPSSRLPDIPDVAVLHRLTWEGHEFLDKARSDKTWNKAIALVKDKGLSLSLDAIKIALGEAVKALMS